MARNERAVLCLGVLAVLGCAAEEARAPEAMIQEAAPLATGAKQRKRLCGRGGQDLVLDAFCNDPPAPVGSLADFRAALGLDTILGSTFEGFAMTGHSTSLSTRSVSAINPRLIYVRHEGEARELLSISFTRGEQFSEAVVRDRSTGELRFYVAMYTQECNDSETGCLPGDLLTEATESNWKTVDVYAEEDLVNTPLDCLVCHQQNGPGTEKILRMQELEPPWNHWFFNLTAGGNAMIADYLAAKGDEPFGGIAGEQVNESNPGLLSSTLFFAGSGDQPNAFDSAVIEREVRQSAAEMGGNQPNDNSVPGESPTWNEIYQRAKRGEAISVPYHDVKITDPAKLAAMTQAYTDYREGRLPREELPDIRDVYPDDEMLLARMGFATEPGLEGKDILLQACAQCHNDRLDQTLSRARFNVDVSKISREERDLAASRIMLDPDDPSVMPPARIRSLSDEAKRALLKYLRE